MVYKASMPGTRWITAEFMWGDWVHWTHQRCQEDILRETIQDRFAEAGPAHLSAALLDEEAAPADVLLAPAQLPLHHASLPLLLHPPLALHLSSNQAASHSARWSPLKCQMLPETGAFGLKCSQDVTFSSNTPSKYVFHVWNPSRSCPQPGQNTDSLSHDCGSQKLACGLMARW